MLSLRGKIKDVEVIERLFSVIRTLVGVGIALVIALILIAAVSDNPVEALMGFLTGPLTSLSRLGNVVEKAIPLFFTGTAVCIVFSCGQISLCIEGIFYITGIACAAIATQTGLAAGVHPLLCILAAGTLGALICAVPALMYIKIDTMTVVSSLMINFICLHIGKYLMHYVMRDPKAGFDASYKFQATARLSKLFSKTNIHLGLIIAIVVVVIGYLALYKSPWGYGVRMTGLNASFAKFQGMGVPAMILSASMAGGFLAGMGGAVEQLGMYKRFSYEGLSGHGWDGIMIAVIAQNNPKLVPFAALFVAYISTGADVVNRTCDVPIEIISIVQAVIIMFVAAERFLEGWKQRKIVQASQQAELEKRAAENKEGARER